MDAKTKELVAIGASIAGHCRPCFEHHLSKARQLGVAEDEIAAVMQLAKVISEKGDERMMEFAETFLEGNKKKNPSKRVGAKGGK